MSVERSADVAALKAKIADRCIEHIKVGVFDGDGILRGKFLHRDKFLSALDKGMGFCDVVLGWDSNDALFDNVKYTGWHTAYPDAGVRLLPETWREIPFEPKSLFVLGEFAGPAEAVCPRATLRRVLESARDMGYGVSASAEFEFFLFQETPDTVRDKGYRQLKTLTPGNFGYSVLRNSVNAELCQELLDLGVTMRFPIEGLHTETGPASWKPRWFTPKHWKRPTAQRCSRRLQRCCASAAGSWRRSWRSGRKRCPGKAVTCTSRCSATAANQCSMIPARPTTYPMKCAGSLAASRR